MITARTLLAIAPAVVNNSSIKFCCNAKIDLFATNSYIVSQNSGKLVWFIHKSVQLTK